MNSNSKLVSVRVGIRRRGFLPNAAIIVTKITRAEFDRAVEALQVIRQVFPSVDFVLEER